MEIYNFKYYFAITKIASVIRYATERARTHEAGGVSHENLNDGGRSHEEQMG